MPNNAHVVIYGTVMQEPKTGTSTNGSPYLMLNVAVKTTKKQEGSQWPASDFYTVRTYGRLATPEGGLIGKVKAKTKVMAIGDMYMGEPYQGRDGKWSVTPQINATHIEITSGGNYNNSNNTNNYNNSNAARNNNDPGDEEAPF